MKYGSYWPTCAHRWDAMEIKPERQDEFTRLAQFAIEHKAQYVEIEEATGVPWWLVAALHRRESDADFGTYLGNGQRLSRVTTIVPEGRGPFPDFKSGAIDALKLDGLTSVIDWRLEKVLWHAERFNGLGYAQRGMPSPYVWGGTNQQRAGKYVSDGKFSSTAWDEQPGCAPLIATIARLDPSVQFVRETPMDAPDEPDGPKVAPPEISPVEAALARIRPILEELRMTTNLPAITDGEVPQWFKDLLAKGKETKPATAEELSRVDALFGKSLIGYKTIIGTAGTIATWIWGTQAGLSADVQQSLLAIFLFITATGVSAKIDRGIDALRALVKVYEDVRAANGPR